MLLKILPKVFSFNITEFWAELWEWLHAAICQQQKKPQTNKHPRCMWLKFARVDSSKMLVNCTCLDLNFAVDCYIKVKKWQQVVSLAFSFLSEESSVMLVFSESIFFGLILRFWLQKIILVNTQNGMWLEEEMLLSVFMFSTIQVNTLSFAHCFSWFLCVSIPSLYLLMVNFFSSSLELYFNCGVAYGCYLLFCLCNPTVVGGGVCCCCCCRRAGIAGNFIYPVFAILWLFL